MTPPFIASDGGSILVTGAGFHPLSEVRVDGLALSTAFSGTVLGANSLTALVPANVFLAGTHQVTVFNQGSGGGESGRLPVRVPEPGARDLRLVDLVIPGGGSDA